MPILFILTCLIQRILYSTDGYLAIIPLKKYERKFGGVARRCHHIRQKSLYKSIFD